MVETARQLGTLRIGSARPLALESATARLPLVLVDADTALEETPPAEKGRRTDLFAPHPEVTTALLVEALRTSNGIRSLAAEATGMSRQAVQQRLAKGVGHSLLAEFSRPAVLRGIRPPTVSESRLAESLTRHDGDRLLAGQEVGLKLATVNEYIRRASADSPLAQFKGDRGGWIYHHKAPSFFRAQILRGKEGTHVVQGRGREFGQRLKDLRLTYQAVATLLGFTGAIITRYCNDILPIPEKVFEIVLRARTKEEASAWLTNFVARATSAYIRSYPHYNDLFELYRLFRERHVTPRDWLGSEVQYHTLKPERAKELIAILKRKGPLPKMWEPKPITHLPAFFARDPETAILRGALDKFNLFIHPLAALFHSDPSHFGSYIRGAEPVPKKWKPYIQALAEENSLERLRVKISRIRAKIKSGNTPVFLTNVAENKINDGLLHAIARKALQKYGLASDADAKDIAQEIEIDRHLAMRRGRIFDDKTIVFWMRTVAASKAFRFFVQSRGVSAYEARFYFRMRDLIAKHNTKTGRRFTPEDLVAFDPSLSLPDAKANLERYKEVGDRLRGTISFEGMSEAAQAQF